MTKRLGFTKEEIMKIVSILEWQTDNLLLLQEHYMKLQGKLFHEKWKFRMVAKRLKEIAPDEAISEEELNERGWEPFQKILLKAESEMYIQSDEDIISVNIKIVNQKEKMSLLEEVIKNLNQRNFQIKNAIDYLKFTGGEI